MESIAAASRARLHLFRDQELANTSWSFAALQWADRPLLDAISAAARTKIEDFRAQELSNTAWSWAKLWLRPGEPLLESIAASAIASLDDMRAQELANTAWALARLAFTPAPLLNAISSASSRHVRRAAGAVAPGASGGLEPRHVEMLLWAFSQLAGGLPLVERLLSQVAAVGLIPGSLALAGPLSACERPGEAVEEGFKDLLLECLAASGRGLLAPAVAALRDAHLAGVEGRDVAHAVARAVREVGVPVGGFAHGDFFAPHEKEVRLLAYVLDTAPPGDPEKVCEAIEAFGRRSLSRAHGGEGGELPAAGQWLKVAGGAKAEVLAAAVQLCPPREGGLRLLEVGAYCGYSALRLLGAAGPSARVLSLEADPGNAVVARCIVAYAGLHQQISVRIGHSEDVLPHLGRDTTVDPFDLVFFDQRGSRYHADLAVLEKQGLLAHSAVLVADNVLKPGAPVFLWHLLFSGRYATELLPLEEYAMPGAEDWMSVSVLRASAGALRGGEELAEAASPPVPALLRRLDWEADRVRWRAERRPGVDFEQWAAFAERMRLGMASVGVAPGAAEDATARGGPSGIRRQVLAALGGADR